MICPFREASSHNLRARIKGFFCVFVGSLLPFVLLTNFLASSSAQGTLEGLVGKEVSRKLHIFAVSIETQKFDVLVHTGFWQIIIIMIV